MQVRQKQKIDKLLGYFLIGLLWPFTRLLGLLMRRDHTLHEAPQRIVFIKLLGLGSLVLASDAIAMIRDKYPNAHLILLTDRNIAAGIRPFGLYDEIREVDSNHFFRTCRQMLAFLFESWTWRRLCIVDLEVYSKLTTILSLLTCARNRFGFILPSVSFRKYLNTHNILFDQSVVLEDNYTNMAVALSGTGSVRPPLLTARTGEHQKRYILFNNTCSSLAYVRKLPEQTLSAISGWVLDNTGYDIAFLGMPEDRAEIDQFIEKEAIFNARKSRIHNYAGQSGSFDAYYDFLRTEGVCLVTIDSGPLHLAKKLGLPTLSLWGPTKPEHYLKIHPGEEERHLVYYLQTSCSPCIHRYEELPCGGDNICMKQLEEKVIIGKMKQLLDHLSGPKLIERKA
ncbi:MAG TPA: glycosyltransferase family 9 protein [Chitinophagaceae bacterium]|nr:glycosyltransferase family 9 protein [Chitinophagaceae bacterium]